MATSLVASAEAVGSGPRRTPDRSLEDSLGSPRHTDRSLEDSLGSPRHTDRSLEDSLGSHSIKAVAYDHDLADRIRELLGTAPTVSEQRMFGGLAFMVRGNMAVAASGQGGLMVRVDPAQSAHLVKTTTARPMIMKGRPMAGWLRVPSDDVRTKPQLRKWVTIGTTFAGSLPAKSPGSRRSA
jgi:TfoX/Sxy family transcriptional regulator of competence genes